MKCNQLFARNESDKYYRIFSRDYAGIAEYCRNVGVHESFAADGCRHSRQPCES